MKSPARGGRGGVEAGVGSPAGGGRPSVVGDLRGSGTLTCLAACPCRLCDGPLCQIWRRIDVEEKAERERVIRDGAKRRRVVERHKPALMMKQG